MIENFMTYLWILVLAFAIVMIFGGILRWIGDKDHGKKRLFVFSICSSIVLVTVFWMRNWESIEAFVNSVSNMDGSMTKLLINVSKIMIKVLVVLVIVAFSLLIVFIAGLLIKNCAIAISYMIEEKPNDKKEQSKPAVVKNEEQSKQTRGYDKKQLESKLKQDTEKLAVLLKSPIFIVGIVGGILALYLFLPLIMGVNTDSIADCWISGVEEIVKICAADMEGDKLVSSLALYSLIFILILGIGYGVGNILFEIIRERFEKKTVFLNEYSNAIGLLAVGISILFMVSMDDDFELAGTLVEYGKPFVVVIFVIALAIFTLEIIRLLIDMKETLIRKEARYLFVLLVGLCSVIIMKAFSIVYNTVNSVFGKKNIGLDSAEDKIEKIYDYILEIVAKDMAEELDTESRLDAVEDVPYNSFQGTTTKK